MVAKFERELSDKALKLLESRPVWWEDVLKHRFKDHSGEEQPLFLAIRNGYLNAYVEGQSVLKIEFSDGSSTFLSVLLKAKIHHKYINEKAKGQAYVTFDGKKVGGKCYSSELFNGLVARAQTYVKVKKDAVTGSEKQGVAVILGRNSNVIDVEMALPANEPVEPNARRVAPRMDIVALEKTDASLKIVFYEAKLFRNAALRAEEGRPKVLDQLDIYEKWIRSEDRTNQVVKAYRRACQLLIKLNAMRRSADPCFPVIDGLIKQAAKEDSNLGVDPKPRLIVFGYNADQVGPKSSWKQNGHEDKLKQALGNRLIMHEYAKDVRLGVGA